MILLDVIFGEVWIRSRMFLTPLAQETLGEKIRRQSCLKSKSVAGAEKKITGYQALNILFKPSFPAGRGNGAAR